MMTIEDTTAPQRSVMLKEKRSLMIEDQTNRVPEKQKMTRTVMKQGIGRLMTRRL
jgi:hypothetical protein